MAEAPAQITVTPQQMGKHLRSIRRRKGLSLSEVARGAGLSRRELVAYERGKVRIPESDLWVLAGSCGVDVAELVPNETSNELVVASSPVSIGDTVSQLRRAQEDVGIAPYLHTLQKLQALPAGKRIPVKERELEAIATALGSTPRAIEEKLREVLHVSPDEAERIRAMILAPPSTGRGKPRALAAASAPAKVEPDHAPVTAPLVTAPPVAAPPVTAPATPEPTVMPSEPVEADDVFQTLPVAPAAFLDTPLDAPVDPVHGHNVDVFEELARLPEPLPLGDPAAPVPDLLAPPDDPFATTVPLVGAPVAGPSDGAVELVDRAVPAPGALGRREATEDAASAWNAVDAPPIDVAMRQGSSTWDLGTPPPAPPSEPTWEPDDWETTGWQPPAPADATNGVVTSPVGFWESTDDWTPPADASPPDVSVDVPAVMPSETETEEALGVPPALGEDTWAGSAWNADPWTLPEPPQVDAPSPEDGRPWTTDDWTREPADPGAWDHHPDPAAVDSGFFVDWGTPLTETPPAGDTSSATSGAPTFGFEPAREPAWEPAADTAAAHALDPEPDVFEADVFETDVFETDVVDVEPTWDPATWTSPFVAEDVATIEIHDREDHDRDDHETVGETEREPAPDAIDTIETTGTEPVPISWRAADEPLDEIVETPAFQAPAFETPDPAPVAIDPAPIATDDHEAFVTAGPDWQLGNALPLVEVRGQGALVMRRADERWALADVVTAADSVLEVDVDFRSGPGFGVLFRASVDDEGRMSGYSFDIDPIYDGGGYLVRQWQADRELWNPIARVGAADPAGMYGNLTVRLVLVDDGLIALVNGAQVLRVDNLKEASAERGRDAAAGDRVGVQAWSSSDLVIETLRVASH